MLDKRDLVGSFELAFALGVGSTNTKVESKGRSPRDPQSLVHDCIWRRILTGEEPEMVLELVNSAQLEL
jgi:hypothetical protein